jgi:subtilase family serine protease
VGTLAADRRLGVTVTLEPRDPAALSARAEAVSTPGTPQYRHFLSEPAFVRLFAPSAATVASVVSTLRAEGLHTGAVSADRLSVPVTATAAQLSRAFSITLATVRLPSGRVAYANTAAPEFDAALAPAIEGVIGLDDLTVPEPLGFTPSPAHTRPHLAPSVTTGGPQPCPTASSDADEFGAYTADQLASAYQFSSFYEAGDWGAGQTVALFELESYLPSDISTYQSCYKTSTSVTNVPVHGGSGSGAGKGEAALDIEDLIGLAPQVSIDVYEGPNSDSGVYDTYSAIISTDTASVISTSWGQCETHEGASAATGENTLFQEAAVQGQSMVAAAGDSGSEDCRPEPHSEPLAVDDPASQPFVTGVGGTTLSALGPPPTQTVWNEKPVAGGAGGGGISELWPMPSYQSTAAPGLNVINTDSSGSPCGASSGDCREVPDISADADPYSGYAIYYDGAWTAFGGTSAAAPLIAAFLALTNASTGCGGVPVGFANPALYGAAATDYAADFSDITSGNNDYTGTNEGMFPATTGYDMASGLGTPVGTGLSEALCAGTSASPQILSGPSTADTVGSPFSFTVTTSGSPLSQMTETGALPSGVTLVDNGDGTATLSGTPADGTTGTYNFVITASNGTAPDATQSFTLTISPAPLTVTAGSTTMTQGAVVPVIAPSYSGFVNGDSETSLTVVPTCSTTATSTSPDGVYPSSCSGASDPDYAVSYVNGTVSVESGFYVATLSVPDATAGQAYNDRLQAVGGVAPYRWKITSGRLPKGLTLALDGLLRGTPRANDTARGYTFTVSVHDSTKGAHQSTTDTLTLTLS